VQKAVVGASEEGVVVGVQAPSQLAALRLPQKKGVEAEASFLVAEVEEASPAVAHTFETALLSRTFLAVKRSAHLVSVASGCLRQGAAPPVSRGVRLYCPS